MNFKKLKRETLKTFLTSYFNNNSIVGAQKVRDRFNSKGQRLIAAGNVEEPFTYDCIFQRASGNTSACDFPGISYDLFEFIAEFLGFKFTLVQPPDHEFGSLVNNSWTGLVGMLNRHEADVTLSPLTYNYLRSQAMEYSAPIFYLKYAYLIKNPGHQISPWIYLLPFNAQIWGCIIATLMLIIFCLAINDLKNIFRVAFVAFANIFTQELGAAERQRKPIIL